MFIGILSYWLVALPISYLSAFKLGFGPPGIWFGFVTGLALAAAALVGAPFSPRKARIKFLSSTQPNSSIVRRFRSGSMQVAFPTLRFPDSAA